MKNFERALKPAKIKLIREAVESGAETYSEISCRLGISAASVSKYAGKAPYTFRHHSTMFRKSQETYGTNEISWRPYGGLGVRSNHGHVVKFVFVEHRDAFLKKFRTAKKAGHAIKSEEEEI